MFSKAVYAFLISLAATAGFAWFIASVCGSDTDEVVAENASQPAQAAVMAAPFVSEEPKATVRVVNAYPKLTFEAPVEYTYANDGTNRVFVVEQAGRIRAFENDPNAASAATYLDIRKKVEYGGEMGLLGLAFHPRFKENGYFFVNYTKSNPRETIVSRFKVSSPDAPSADPASEVVLFRFKQPYSNHNGGKVAFGPDGYLYVATGDGGSGGDPQNNGQNRSSWLGKILRVDVNSTEKGHYGIPKDNPFAGKDGLLEEIYAYGLRNPWRFSFDERGRLWTGDVGQNEIEEIDIVSKGGNYGWRIREANESFKPNDPKPADKLIDPIHEYHHGDDGNSVTGGVVYRGAANSSLRGKYIYGDFGSGRLWALAESNGEKTGNQLLINRAGSISAFGEDPKRELYICDYGDGKILKLVSE